MCQHKTAALLAVPLLAACEGPLSTLTPAGPAAQDAARLWWAMLIGSGLLTLMVCVMLVLALRARAGTGRGERFWIWGWGVGFSLTVLTVLVGFSLWLGERMLARADDALRVEAHASRWEWVFSQPGPGGVRVRTVDTLYVPAGESFDVVITSADVIHSFWVPQLGGKMDAIPGYQNVHRLRADAPGIYEGLCAEFCGAGHPFMRFSVVVYDPASGPPDMSEYIIEDAQP